ncbi:hypothetical protein MF271_06125 [Deinococcus sp. KNUC1210]|uniref:hypothetical protein n=1 Tax=Deinococcus sp. KNUC1210 TaxID=2917691 RepID=UPI001EEFE5B7|nr:hypothetical protein [Deinococcus sp. KNUC1210]ULH16190.1 hypothetical protein MF271_06125 [Deinococcus sp. KNUC1210]
MKLSVFPILKELRALYDVGERNTLERFWAYKALMVDGPQPLPLGDFSPMGKRQPEYLDSLLSMNAEALSATFAQEIEAELSAVQAEFRLLLVVVDQPNNGWTQRWLSDAAWRFGPEKVPQNPDQTPARRWVTVQLWTHVPPTPDSLRAQVRGAVRRAVWRMQHGPPVTLAQMMRQEGAALAYGGGTFAGQPLVLEPDELAYTREVLEALRPSDHWPTCFAALYGDEAATEVGFPPLGMSRLAGLGLALEEAPADELTRPLSYRADLP